MKNLKMLIPIIFPVILILLLGIGAILLPDHTFSTSEMRYLKRFPSCSVEELFSGDYGQKLENYASDQFPLRDAWIKAADQLMLTFQPNCSK